MRGIVLAAGRGSRLGPATADRPKCLVEVAGRTLLDRQVGALRAAGAADVAAVVGWRADRFAGLGLPLFVNPDWDRTTMVDTLMCAAAWMARGTTLISYGDIVYSAATARMLAARDAHVAISYDPHWHGLWAERFERPLDDAETFALNPGGIVADIGGRPDTIDSIEGQYIGLLRVTTTGWRELRRAAGDGPPPRDMTGLLQRVIRAGRLAVAAVPVVGRWYEFDQPSDLERGRAVVEQLDAGIW
ncbi:NTP transferase domain-containing protein [Dactylosporangium sp. CA-139066]|uniref:phosphocholine cytidylyltransferase family protein n=1 Tax=Dactylosporangium sp. CA-139066 TaxID=3239930 RepID=UPI003D91894B